MPIIDINPDNTETGMLIHNHYISMAADAWLTKPSVLASLIKEVNPGLAKRPLKIDGRLANRWLTSSVKEATTITGHTLHGNRAFIFQIKGHCSRLVYFAGEMSYNFLQKSRGLFTHNNKGCNTVPGAVVKETHKERDKLNHRIKPNKRNGDVYVAGVTVDLRRHHFSHWLTSYLVPHYYIRSRLRIKAYNYLWGAGFGQLWFYGRNNEQKGRHFAHYFQIYVVS